MISSRSSIHPLAHPLRRMDEPSVHPCYGTFCSIARSARAVRRSAVSEGDDIIPAMADDVFVVPPADEIIAPMISVIPLQLLSYYIGVEKGCDVDKPRNLAKSVTVE